jgi:hypothetical protein
VFDRKWPDAPAAMITFDDAYKDNFTRARPVLKRHGVPAIFFVPTKLVEDRQLGWWDHIAYLVKRTPRRDAEIEGRRLDLEDQPAAIRELQYLMKVRPESETRDLVCRLALASTWPSTRAEQSDELMTWADLRACAEDGITMLQPLASGIGYLASMSRGLSCAWREISLRAVSA